MNGEQSQTNESRSDRLIELLAVSLSLSNLYNNNNLPAVFSSGT